METLTKQQQDSLLSTVPEGERVGISQWLPEVYDALRGLAGQYIRNMGPQSLFQPTALVNEAYLKLADKQTGYWNGRTHFVAVSARAMRFVLVNHLRDRQAAKRGGSDARQLTLEGTLLGDSIEAIDVVALSDLLEVLTGRSERQARIVELRVFGGLTIDETAKALEVSPSTVKSDWTIAAAWLKAQL